ncbi:MAG TPA: zf-HC2 domain-containing protein [Methylomirabilota bacterium]|nr:zf-HC2 domain-containing protein [Methylomirabilota bacterium]
MTKLACLWIRGRLERLMDGALGLRAARAAEAHLGRCEGCRAERDRLNRLHALLRESLTAPADPDWGRFWPGLRTRILREHPEPVREPWWLPLWKPFWGHPRLAVGGVMAAVFALTLSFWPGGDVAAPPAAWAGPVVVQDVATSDPQRGVMVYSSPDHDVTVIWVFNSDESSEES